MVDEPKNLTQLMAASSAGDLQATDELYRVIYGKLRSIAAGHRWKWSGNFTMSTTAIVHEAFIKLAGSEGDDWQDRAHFFRMSARAMRQVLINYAEQRNALKRGGGEEPLQLDEELVAMPEKTSMELLSLDAALAKLEKANQRLANVIECRYFGGLTVEETAQSVGQSPATVKRNTKLACAWLARELGEAPPELAS